MENMKEKIILHFVLLNDKCTENRFQVEQKYLIL